MTADELRVLDEPIASAGEHRALMSRFPTGVAVVTAADTVGRPHGMTCSSVASVTLCPPTILVCLRVGSATLRAVHEGGAFAVNLLDAEARATAELFSGPVPDRFARVRWIRSHAGLPWLVDDALAMAECRLSRVIPDGDHEVLFGRLLRVTEKPGTPLLYGMRSYSVWRPSSLAGSAGMEDMSA
ncbi:flavin reductase family protein [Nonomuraea sp. KC401]|uniref:Flavin reductase n=1 Tax=Nonomuraea longispora TaxID=1848320 RepID=A0A4R4NQ62_9ACTN|nr:MULTISPECIES: flavin reductase family protein [Nonomuraea]NBE91756.1 flavin reductase [Nonomuraea sp. K271]TDC10063.1 flavin reductase [Nonomuraea longispora]TLF86363.1 flavin reductase family protein [Nonomuraea sp. KC401]